MQLITFLSSLVEKKPYKKKAILPQFSEMKHRNSFAVKNVHFCYKTPFDASRKSHILHFNVMSRLSYI